MENSVEPQINDTLKNYRHQYYLNNKEKLNHDRLGFYHRKKHNIPIEKLDCYLKNRTIYNTLIKYKKDLDLEFIQFIFSEL